LGGFFGLARVTSQPLLALTRGQQGCPLDPKHQKEKEKKVKNIYY